VHPLNEERNPVHDPVRAPRGTEISCKGWAQEAALRVLMNNLAVLLLEQNQNEEALDLAKQAVELAGPNQADPLDTLGVAYTRTGKLEAAEEVLKGLGFHQYRARHHGNLCRVEIDPADFPNAAALPAQCLGHHAARGAQQPESEHEEQEEQPNRDGRGRKLGRPQAPHHDHVRGLHRLLA